jgi:hypothetical protein
MSLSDWMKDVLGAEIDLNKLSLNQFSYLVMAVISTVERKQPLTGGKKIKFAFIGFKNIIVYITDNIYAVKADQQITNLSLENELMLLRKPTIGIPQFEISCKVFMDQIGYTLIYLRQLSISNIIHLSRFVAESRTHEIKIGQRERKCYCGKMIFDLERCQIIKY